METSRTARSNSPARPRATASAPSPASSATRRSAWRSRIVRSPWRTTGWSSARRILATSGVAGVTRRAPGAGSPRRRNAAVEARVDLKATVLAEAAAEADEVRDEVGDPPELRVSAVRLCPTSSCSSAARRRRSSSCADCVRRAVPALGLQSVEHLVKRRGEKGDLRLRTMDGDALPRRERSIVAIAARSRLGGANARRISRRFTAGRTSSPPSRTTKRPFAGSMSRTTDPAVSTVAFGMNRRQKSKTYRPAGRAPDSSAGAMSELYGGVRISRSGARSCRRPQRSLLAEPAGLLGEVQDEAGPRSAHDLTGARQARHRARHGRASQAGELREQLVRQR